jgi:glyoxalase family protein
MNILGLHHITIGASNAQRTLDFYTGVLGLRLVKQTVNFDDPSTYHLYFGDHVGSPGTAITFFEWPKAPKGKSGIGGTHHVALQVADETGLLKWKRRLIDLGLSVDGPFDREYFKSIYFHDPDGLLLEIATRGPGFTVNEAAEVLGSTFMAVPEALKRANRDEAAITAAVWDQPVPEITPDMALTRGMHHITAISSDIERTHAFFSGVLGLQRVKMTDNFDVPNSAHWYWGLDNGQPGTLITYFEYKSHRAPYVEMGVGQTHHYAFAVKDEQEQAEWRKRLNGAGYRVSQILDRKYFRSIYTNDPDGHIVELATVGPGFTVDENEAVLGQTLQLPPWLEQHRAVIQPSLTPLIVPEWSKVNG